MGKSLILIIIVLISFWVYSQLRSDKKVKSIDVSIKDKRYHLEVATTIFEKATGLMNRDTLCPDCGMVFVFDDESPQSFWMKSTRIPLDMIFLDSSKKVINIETAYPEPGTPDLKLKQYRSLRPAMYVIEINAGESKKIGLLPDNSIDFELK